MEPCETVTDSVVIDHAQSTFHWRHRPRIRTLFQGPRDEKFISLYFLPIRRVVYYGVGQNKFPLARSKSAF